MPVHEKLHVAGDPLDLSPERGLRKSGELAGNLGVGDIRNTGSASAIPLGTADIAVPTGVSAADSATANAADVTYSFPSGITKVEIITTKHSDGSFVSKKDSTSSPETVTGLVVGTQYDFEVRGIDSNGRPGHSAALVSATVA